MDSGHTVEGRWRRTAAAVVVVIGIMGTGCSSTKTETVAAPSPAETTKSEAALPACRKVGPAMLKMIQDSLKGTATVKSAVFIPTESEWNGMPVYMLMATMGYNKLVFGTDIDPTGSSTGGLLIAADAKTRTISEAGSMIPEDSPIYQALADTDNVREALIWC